MPNGFRLDSQSGSSPEVIEIAQAKAPAAPKSPEEELGQRLFNDVNLSNPAGQACSSCHDEDAGDAFPDSNVNASLGTSPGVVPGRFGLRKVPNITYDSFLPFGPPHYDNTVSAFVGGLFWDGRASDLADQAQQPFFNPNEMNDVDVVDDGGVLHGVGDPALVVAKVAQDPHVNSLFKTVFGKQIFSNVDAAFSDIASAIAAYEQIQEFHRFTSRYDRWLRGEIKLTPQEMDGLRLVTGSWTGRPGGAAYYKIIDGKKVYKFAQCVLCHSIPSNSKDGPDIWTNSSYANIGVPKNPDNPYYTETDTVSNPLGYNPQGADFVDLGLGGTYYPSLGLPPGNIGPTGENDFLNINGTFRAPTLRNVDQRPYPGFVKVYMHNGVFKSLKQVVHFYNTRNLTTYPGEVIDFTKPNPYANLKGKPLWSAPEYPSANTLQNPQGLPGPNSQVGNLGLTDAEENHIVAFLQALTDH
ncbi:MAG TPA: cytochrome c peroxidase [Capsulimonadaceae bacterium]|nr:cytochrome c peroxidase [Capsulimonadaceae bacterium]